MNEDQALVYTGDCANGQGTCAWPNGDKYEGAWVNKLYHGQGKYSWARGDTYEGEWRGGVIQGQGRMRFSSSSQYEGSWFKAEPHGLGTWSWSCGGSWRGHFAKGKPVPIARKTSITSGDNAREDHAIWMLGARLNLPCVQAPGPSKSERHARAVPPRILQAAELAQMQSEDAVLTEVNVRWRNEAVAKERLRRARTKARRRTKDSRVQARSLCVCGAQKMNAPCICEGVVGRPSTRASSRASARSAGGRVNAMSSGAARPATRASSRVARATQGTRRVRGRQGNVVAQRSATGERPATTLGLRRGNVLRKAISSAASSSSLSPLGRTATPSSLPALRREARSPALLVSFSSAPSSPAAVVNFSALVNGTPKQLTKRSLSNSPSHSRNASVASSRVHSRRSSQTGGCPLPSSMPNEIVKRLEALPAVYRLDHEIEK